MPQSFNRSTIALAFLFFSAGAAHAQTETQVPLNYNFNGMAHFFESGIPDDLSGYRSISDRGLLVDGSAGTLGTSPITGSTGMTYQLEMGLFVPDMVHLGDRGVFHPFEATAPGTDPNRGVQPDWLPVTDQTTPQTTDVSSLGLEMFGNTQIGFLYQISNSGGSFQVELAFTDATAITVTLSGPDWFGSPAVPAPGPGVFSQSRLGAQTWPAVNQVDNAGIAPVPGQNLNVTEAIISVQELISDGFGDITGKTLSSITFQNAVYPANVARGYGIIAATVRGSEMFPPLGIGSIDPNPAVYNEQAVVTVAVSRGSGTPNGISSVEVDASAINAGVVSLSDDGTNGDEIPGDDVWAAEFTIPPTAPAGQSTLFFTITDEQFRVANGQFNVSIVAPPAAIDLGTLSEGVTTFDTSVAPAGVEWVRFTLAQDVDAAAMTFLDIDTEGSAMTPTNDTELGIYRANGTLVASDDDDGSGLLTQLTFGLASPARPPVGNGATYNGRDGALLPAGDYYMAISGFNTTFGGADWNATSTSSYSGPVHVNIALGSVTPGSVPTEFTDLGTLADGVPQTASDAIDAGGVAWFRFTLDTPIDSPVARTFLDIDTETSGITDTVIGLFRDDGTLIAQDNDDGSGLWSQLTFGRGTRPAPGDGLAYNGRDGATLAAGTYFLAVGESSITFGSNWVIFLNTGTNPGSVTANIRRGTEPPPAPTIIAGPIVNPANGHEYYLFGLGMTFYDAEAAAQVLGGHLASIADADENEWVRANVLRFGDVDRRGFIGFTDAAAEGDFQWTDGSPVTFTNWSAGEPNNAGGTEHFTEMFGSNGMWNDVNVTGVTAGDFAIAEVVPVAECPGDYNGDGVRNTADFFEFFGDFFGTPPDADYNMDGATNTADFFEFFSDFFGPPCD